MFKLQRSRIQNMRFAVDIFWHIHDLETYNNNVDIKESYNHAKFEKSHFNDTWEKANIEVFSDNMSIISLEHVQKSEIVVYSWFTWHYWQL